MSQGELDPSRSSRPPLRRRRGVVVAALGGVVVLAAGLVYWASSVGLSSRLEPALTQAPATTCAGPAGGTAVVYLHGIDPPLPSAQEQENRKAIARIAEGLGIRVALARSPSPCPRDASKRCWPNDSRVAVESAYTRLLADTSSCFGGRVPAAIVGFSNGGYFVGKLFQYCLAPDSSLIGIGGAGSFKPGEARSLAACGRFQLLIGREDHLTHDDAVAYARRLSELRGNVRLTEYDGAHVLPEDEVRAALSASLGR